MNFDIDVSGGDLLSKSYTICIANNDSLIKGYTFDEKTVKVLASRYGQGLYPYAKSQKGKATFKVRLYCIVVYYLFRSLSLKEPLRLTVCRDFYGRENDIRENLRHLLIDKLGLPLQEDAIQFRRLDKQSNAHQYAFLMRKDKKKQMTTYVPISVEDIEAFLKK